MNAYEKYFEEKMSAVLGTSDPAHDILHIKRVVKIARDLCDKERANLEVVLPAAWLHDIVNLPKNHQDRKIASKFAAIEAIGFLKTIGYPAKYFPEIFHAIEAHSFSSGIVAETLEAQIIQDADRLDALGAIGLARLFSVSTQLGRPFYHFMDPYADNRALDDTKFGIDHIGLKIKILSENMNTTGAQIEARLRFQFIETYLDQLKKEI